MTDTVTFELGGSTFELTLSDEPVLHCPDAVEVSGAEYARLSDAIFGVEQESEEPQGPAPSVAE